MNELATVAPQQVTAYVSPFSTAVAFEAAMQMAKVVCQSTFVPAPFQGERNLGNVVMAMDMANRMRLSYMTVVQNMDVIFNKPAFKSTFIIGLVNAGSRFTPLEFETCGTPGQDDSGCRAKATDKASGKELVGTWITIKMAKAEGWFSRKDSKWPNMPEQMLRYRAACFWQRIYNPEATLGLPSSEEIMDVPPQPDRPEIRTVSGEAVSRETVPFVPVPITALPPADPAPPTDPAPTIASADYLEKLRVDVASAFKQYDVAWKDVQAAAVAGEWFERSGAIAFKDLNKEELEYLLKRAERIAKGIKNPTTP